MAVGQDAPTSGRGPGLGARQDHGLPLAPREASPAGAAAAGAQQLLRDSIADLRPHSAKVMSYFFGALFVRRPEFRRLFPLALGPHGERVFGALARYVSAAEHPETLAEWLSGLAADHRKFGVTEDDYRPFSDALLAAVRAFRSPTWAPRTDPAWEDALSQLAMTMSHATQAAGDTPAWWLAEVVAHELRGPDVAVITVRPDPPLPYRAGQHVSVQVPPWPRQWREYSVANAPRPDGLLRFHVRAVPGGRVSPVLVHHTEPGATLVLGRARGGVTAESVTGGPVVCFAGGTGLGQVKALAEVLAGPSGQPPGRALPPLVQVFFGARREDGLYDLADLRRLADVSARLTVVPVVSDEPGYAGMRGTLADAAATISAATSHVIISGPPAMVAETAVRAAASAPGALVRFDPPPALHRR